MTASACPFCTIGPDRVFYSGPLVIGFWDAFPVNPGHALLAPRRHIASWFDATPAERAELMEATVAAREAIARAHPADGFNIGINIGAAAGQTVAHLHVHVIPRIAGDVPDPRGGVRHVVPAKGNYLAGALGSTVDAEGERALVTGEEDPLLPHLIGYLARAERADIAVGFVQDSGVRRIEAHLQDLLDRGGRLRLLTGDYLDITDPVALARLLDLDGLVERRIFRTSATGRSFHPKAYIFQSRDGSGAAFVGSSNLSQMALADGVEWNYRVVTQRDAAGFAA
ncbi:MAG: HIT domain-containing protein, partial [Vicinamibacterales bacterium]